MATEYDVRVQEEDVAIDDLLALYISEGAAEGVRGDMALAQAVLETGHFTNSDTSRHNYAGIAHYDGSASGTPFASPLVGVRAQIQLLKKYALGNDERFGIWGGLSERERRKMKRRAV